MPRFVLLLLLALGAALPAAQAQTRLSRPPEALETVSPVYPDSALRYGVSARVEVRARIDTLGVVRLVQVVRSAGVEFDSAAVEAVRLWQFRPALQNGRPVAAWVRLPVQFSPEYLVQAVTAGEASRIEPLRLPADIERGELADGTVGLGPGSIATTAWSLRPETCGERFQPHATVTARVNDLGLTRYFLDDPQRGMVGMRSAMSQLLVGIDAQGYVEHVGLARATGYMIDDLLRDAVRNWTFQPARCGGQAIAARAILTFTMRNRGSARLYTPPTNF